MYVWCVSVNVGGWCVCGMVCDVVCVVVCVLVCVCVCARACVCVHVHKDAHESQKRTMGILLDRTCLTLLRQGLSLNLELGW